VPVVKRARQLRPEEIEALVEHYRHHGTVVAAKAMGVTRQSAGKHLADAGISTVRRMTDSDIAAACSEYAAGVSAAAIGRRLGFATNTILSAVARD
jgi:hypothetical protein